MKVKVKKRKTTVLGSPLFKGTQLEVTKEQYNMYQDEFEIIKESKPKYKKEKPKKEVMKEIELEE